MDTKNEYRPISKRKSTDEMTQQELVREFAELKVWFAVHEVTGRVPAGDVRHTRLRRVVDEMRSRNLLD